MRTVSFITLLMVLSGCATTAAEAPANAPFDVTVTESQRYSPGGWSKALYADIFQPDRPGPNPAVLMVHGGGWEGRHRSDMEARARQIARAGFVVVNIDHRFAPANRFPAQLHDVQQAMHWIHDNAGQYGIDPRRISAYGYSSGAHLVSLLALVAGQGGELDTPYGGEKTRPVAVVAGGIPSDLTKFDSGRRLIQLLGGREEEMPERYRRASPVFHVHDQAPPFFLFHGTLDGLVPFDHSEDFHQALRDAGVTSELYPVRMRGHFLTFLMAGGATEEAINFLYNHQPR